MTKHNAENERIKRKYFTFLKEAKRQNYIITFNKKDFPGVERFNIRLATPKEFMQILGA